MLNKNKCSFYVAKVVDDKLGQIKLEIVLVGH